MYVNCEKNVQNNNLAKKCIIAIHLGTLNDFLSRSADNDDSDNSGDSDDPEDFDDADNSHECCQSHQSLKIYVKVLNFFYKLKTVFILEKNKFSNRVRMS